MVIEMKAGPDDSGRRLDRILRKALPEYSLSLIHRLLRQGKVLVDGERAGPDGRVQPGSVIRVAIREQHGVGPVKTIITAKSEGPPDLQSLILWRGSGIIVFNKPPGIATHGKASLDALVKAWLDGKLPSSLSFKPGPLHRLDRPTSGVIAFSETSEGARLFSRLLRERKAVKTYLAIVEGRVSGDAVWQDNLVRDKRARKTIAGEKTGRHLQSSKNALTAVKALDSNGSYTLIEAHIVTGRTHQIRAQSASHGHPLAGDVKYGGHPFPGGFYLHAWKLELGEYLEDFPRPLIAPLPEPLQSRITALFGCPATVSIQ